MSIEGKQQAQSEKNKQYKRFTPSVNLSKHLNKTLRKSMKFLQVALVNLFLLGSTLGQPGEPRQNQRNLQASSGTSITWDGGHYASQVGGVGGELVITKEWNSVTNLYDVVAQGTILNVISAHPGHVRKLLPHPGFMPSTPFVAGDPSTVGLCTGLFYPSAPGSSPVDVTTMTNCCDGIVGIHVRQDSAFGGEATLWLGDPTNVYHDGDYDITCTWTTNAENPADNWGSVPGVAPAPAPAPEPLANSVYYGNQLDGDVLQIDTATATVTNLGNLGVNWIDGAATTPDGRILAIVFSAFGGSYDLVDVDVNNPAISNRVTLTGYSGTSSGLAVSCSGVVYMSFGHTPGFLGTIDLNTGVVTTIGSHTDTRMQALAFAPDGTLYAVNLHGLGTIDITTGVFTLIGPNTNLHNSVQTLQWDYNGNRLLGARFGMFEVNTATGAFTPLPGDYSSMGDVRGLAAPTRPACMGGSSGDPHFNTWFGKWYDFHGICDLVLLSAPGFSTGLGLDVHIRTKPRYEYSYIETAAIKMGDDVLEVGSWGDYIFNGVRDAEMPLTMGGRYTVVHEQINKKRHSFKIQTGENEAIIINTHKDLVNVNVLNATYANFATSTGMMGNFHNGALVARDGNTIMDDHNLFGQEWQVTEADGEFFQSPSPYKQCVPPSSIKQSRRRLGEATVSEEAATIACAHHKDEQMKDMCVFDVIAMADLEVAEVHGAY